MSANSRRNTLRLYAPLAGLLLALLAVPPPQGRPRRPASSYVVADLAVTGLQTQLAAALHANRRAFLGRTGLVEGFGAGAHYPQVWLRDSATLLPGTRYLYEAPWLSAWLLEHLAHQQPDGLLWDWIAAGPVADFRADAPAARPVDESLPVPLVADRNTTESDQEPSAVEAAWVVFEMGGGCSWLSRDAAGASVGQRLDRALSALLAQRLDPGTGLVMSALTADWGDVSSVWPDQRVIYLDERTPRVGSLYATVMAHRAADRLARMFETCGPVERSRAWDEAAFRLRRAVDRLWLEDLGFYRMQVRLPGPAPEQAFDDRDVFALGGNALAALYGLASQERCARIFEAADRRSREHGFATVGAVLLPPFPAGFFRHPILTEPYTYQNGGQWDWWAGRLVLAAFERGDAERARRWLSGLAVRAARTGGLHEWYGRDEVGRGSASYAGSAGALAGAVFQGLLGVTPRPGGLDVRVRLGGESGRAALVEPASARRVAYEMVAEADRLRLDVDVARGGDGLLELLLPAGRQAASFTIDGRPCAVLRRELGKDRYAGCPVRWGRFTAEVQLDP